jgi:hypothetical protein
VQEKVLRERKRERERERERVRERERERERESERERGKFMGACDSFNCAKSLFIKLLHLHFSVIVFW